MVKSKPYTHFIKTLIFLSQCLSSSPLPQSTTIGLLLAFLGFSSNHTCKLWRDFSFLISSPANAHCLAGFFFQVGPSGKRGAGTLDPLLPGWSGRWNPFLLVLKITQPGVRWTTIKYLRDMLFFCFCFFSTGLGGRPGTLTGKRAFASLDSSRRLALSWGLLNC